MIFVDREEELKRFESRTLQFPLPAKKSTRSRSILFLIGAKGVGKTSLLKQLIKRGVKDTKFVYVEFRGPYESVEDLLIDLLVQYHANLGKGLWGEALRKSLEALGIKLLGKEVIDTIMDPGNIEFLRQSRPTMIIRQLEEEACKMCEKTNTRLVIIYDEFQNFLKMLQIGGKRFTIFLDSFVTYLSKSQEWGFDSTNGYPIRILSTSDYTFHAMMTRYLTSYLEEESIEELGEEHSRELFKACLKEFGLKSDDLAETYVSRVLGGNPSLFPSLFVKLKEKTDFVTLEDAEEILEERIKEIQSFLKAQDYVARTILRCLRQEWQEEKDKWVSLSRLEKSANLSVRFEASLEDLLLKNILQVHQGRVAFQNRLLQFAAENAQFY